MAISIIDPITDSRWDKFVEKHPLSTIFHHSVWARVLRERYSTEPAYYVEETDNGEIAAGIPFFRVRNLPTGNRLVCLPCSEYCYPLTYSPERVARLMDAAAQEVREGRVSFLELRGWEGPPAADLGLRGICSRTRHVTSLPDNPQDLRAKLEKSSSHLSRNLKRSLNSGLVIRRSENEDDLVAFHRLTVVTRRRLRLLPWPYRYLESVYRNVVLSGYGFLVLAELDGRVVAGSMYFKFKDSVLLKFNASLKEFSQYRPNYLVTWSAMERSCLEKYRSFDFGITDAENSGLLSFKRQWAAQETPMPYYYYPSVQGTARLTQDSLLRRTHMAFNGLAPQVVLNATASAFYRYLG
jgi:CelD/BcsL family acetyltransferase involved in cellulose biosynthesis